MRALYEWIVDNDCTPYLLVDATRPGVEVPSQYVKGGQIVLNVSPSPVTAIIGIYARENGQGMVFEPEEPPESPDDPPGGDDGGPTAGKAEVRPALKIVK